MRVLVFPVDAEPYVKDFYDDNFSGQAQLIVGQKQRCLFRAPGFHPYRVITGNSNVNIVRPFIVISEFAWSNLCCDDITRILNLVKQMEDKGKNKNEH